MNWYVNEYSSISGRGIVTLCLLTTGLPFVESWWTGVLNFISIPLTYSRHFWQMRKLEPRAVNAQQDQLLTTEVYELWGRVQGGPLVSWDSIMVATTSTVRDSHETVYMWKDFVDKECGIILCLSTVTRKYFRMTILFIRNYIYDGGDLMYISRVVSQWAEAHPHLPSVQATLILWLSLPQHCTGIYFKLTYFYLYKCYFLL